jgi:hypothetical protein
MQQQAKWAWGPRANQLGMALAVLGITGCSGGSTTASLGADPGHTNLEQGFDGFMAPSDFVAEVTIAAPAEEAFLLQATVPVPKGTYTDGALSVPLSVAGYSGSASPTQIEIVSRYPDESDGADVIQVLAHVRRPSGVAAGEPLTYKIGVNPHPRRDIILTESIEDLLDTPGTLRLMAHDAYGHTYSTDILKAHREETDSASILREGQIAKEIRTHSVMEPQTEVTGAQPTLPHFFGVHAYLTAFRGEDFVAVDLHVHNGMDGLDPGDPNGRAMADLYFDDLVLRLPPGWKATVSHPNPWQGDMTESDGWAWSPLVKSHADNKVHLMPKQGRLVRRLVVHRAWAAERAQAYLDRHWQGFSTDTDMPNGNRGWSWWNHSTARYFPQNHRLPDLTHLGPQYVRNQLNGRYDNIAAQLDSGETGNYPFMAANMGWAHPWGVAYGGMAGGDEIFMTDGFKTAWAGSRKGYLTAQLISRGYIDRQPTALYGVEGDPTRLEDLMGNGPQGPYARTWFYERPMGDTDPFNFNAAPTHQTAYVAAGNMKPAYDGEMRTWMHIDHQHLIRYTRNLKVLLWLGNDSMSKDLLDHTTEMIRLSYHEFPIGSYYHMQPTQLLPRQQFVADHPRQGFDFRRSECWGLDAAVCTYATGTVAERERLKAWFDQVVDLVHDGQSACTGNIMSAPIGQLFDGQYRVRQTFEEIFTDNLLRSMNTSVYRDKDSTRADTLDQVVLASAYSTITPPFWNVNMGRPAFHIGVAPMDANMGEFCYDIPVAAFSGYTDDLNPFASMAFGYAVNQDPMFLMRSAEILGGGDLRTVLQARGLWGLEQSALLLAAVQEPPPMP